MSSPPQTPHRPPTSHRRHPSSLDLRTTPSRYSVSRRSSAAGYSPITPRSSHGIGNSLANELDDLGDGVVGGDFGTLADELAEAWDEEEEETEEDVHNGFEDELERLRSNSNSNSIGDLGRDSGIAIDSPVGHSNLAPSVTQRSARYHRRKTSRYDGSDYGSDSELEAPDGISAGLEARIAAVEGLVKRGLEENGSSADTVVARLTGQLRDLGSQAAAEGGATRLTTANTSITTHLTHQTRVINSLTSSLLGPFAVLPSLELIDELLPLLVDTLESLPQPPTAPIFALHALTNSTRELLASLSYLSDSLQISRETTTTATRRLKTVTEAMGEWKRERELEEEGRRWIEKGEWERRLREREAKKVCGEVVGGFEEVGLDSLPPGRRV
ncbi:hypothetical protein M501DRAFT_1025218 [Patellaria atrata CBS 101060]|uniref:Uncharacterized protein n=1 Tax=Patellaria atrata CBS 101060 TaxID=1346257 RepID=A0A9P4S8D1_9PEZI|nr:hypothetical protein M501DRAFT_1025218 [Patellaria atrata CBS 101060]